IKYRGGDWQGTESSRKGKIEVGYEAPLFFLVREKNRRSDRLSFFFRLIFFVPITTLPFFYLTGAARGWPGWFLGVFFLRPKLGKKLYVGNLSYGMTDTDLHNLFGTHGGVQSAQVIKDRDTGRSKGFGFVEMDSGEAAQAAIAALNGQDVNGRALTVNEARP